MHDNNGSLILNNTGGQFTTYTWDQENRLIPVAVPSTGVTTSVYSDDGKRQATINNSGTTNFIYDGDIVLQEINPSGIVTQYAQGPGTWGLLLARNSGGTIDYYGPDDQQNVRLYLNTTGGVTGAYYTDAFGNIVSALSVPNNFIWSGNVGAYAEILNYYRLLHRLVDSQTGRFINDDPLDFEGGSPNLRTYAGDNPIAWQDPSGFLSTEDKHKHKRHHKPHPPSCPTCSLPSSTRPPNPTQVGYDDVREAVLSVLSGCRCNSTKHLKEIRMLATMFACIAKAESSLNLSATNDTGPCPAHDELFGLFQPDCVQLVGCHAANNYWSVESQVTFAVNIAGFLCKKDGSIYNGLKRAFGTMQGQGGNETFFTCLADRSVDVTDLQSIPCSVLSCFNCNL